MLNVCDVFYIGMFEVYYFIFGYFSALLAMPTKYTEKTPLFIVL
jgi:hypothetical protein